MADKPEMPTNQEFCDAIVARIQDKPEAFNLCWSIVCRVYECLEAGGKMVIPPDNSEEQ